MKTPFSLAALLLLSGCALARQTPPDTRQAAAVAEELPIFMQYRAGRNSPVPLSARSGGVLTQRGKCLGMIRDDGRFATLVWPAEARMEVDARGLTVVDAVGGERVRPGDYISFSGGPLPPGTVYPLGDDLHTFDMPMECAHWPGYDGWIAIVNPGFRKGRR